MNGGSENDQVEKEAKMKMGSTFELMQLLLV